MVNFNIKQYKNLCFYVKGQFLGDMNRYAESAKILERAIGLGNNDFQLVFNAANTLRYIYLAFIL